MKKTLFLAFLVLCAALLGWCLGCGPAPEPAPAFMLTPTPAPTATLVPTATPAPTPFSIVWMSDTQLYTSSYPDILPAMTQWVTDNREKENIVCLVHTGDLLQAGFNEVQQQRLTDAVKLLPKDLLCVTAAGNHDRALVAPFYRYYADYRFDTALVPEQSIYDGECSYVTFEAGDMKLLLLSVAYLREKDCVDWANQVLAAHPDRYAILLVHSYLDPLLDDYNDGYTSSGDTLLSKVVSVSPNLRMVLCGHMHGVCYRAAELDDNGDGETDRLVQQMMFNPQEDVLGGGGYLRLLTFHPENDTVEILSYSPYLDVYGIPGDPFGKTYTLTDCGLSLYKEE